jgi:hypothetical protein
VIPTLLKIKKPVNTLFAKNFAQNKKPNDPFMRPNPGTSVFALQPRQPGHPTEPGPLAFRPPITQSLALSASFSSLIYIRAKFYARKKLSLFQRGKAKFQFFFQRSRHPDDLSLSVDEGMERPAGD